MGPRASSLSYDALGIPRALSFIYFGCRRARWIFPFRLAALLDPGCARWLPLLLAQSGCTRVLRARSTPAALNRTQALILTAFNFSVGASQWRVVSPIRKAAKVSARVSKSRGGLSSMRESGAVPVIFFPLSETRLKIGTIVQNYANLVIYHRYIADYSLPRKQHNVPERYLLRDLEAITVFHPVSIPFVPFRQSKATSVILRS